MSTIHQASGRYHTAGRSGSRPLRIGALCSLAALTSTYVAVLYYVTSVVASTTRLTLVVGISLFAAILFAGVLAEREAAVVAGGLVVLGLIGYVGSTPGVLEAITGMVALVQDILALLSGYTVLAIIAVDVWALAVAPAPIFLSWYFAIRARYAEAAGVGLALLIFLVLTGDAGIGHAVIGVLGAAGTVGFGELSKQDVPVADADVVVIVLAAMLAISLAVSVVPGGGAQPISPGTDADEPIPTDVSLLGGDGELTVSGQPSLDPTVRFTVTAEEPGNWRVDAYDRYTGDGWVQTGDYERFDGSENISHAERVDMHVQVERDGEDAMPAHWKPLEVSGVDGVISSPGDGLYATSDLEAGDRYTVVSASPAMTPDELRGAGDDYPAHIEERYTQLPGSTPDRVGELTADLIAETDSDYEAARTIEQYIIATNDYSLDVDAPDGDIPDAQLFERDAGYCTLFATTMVVMLRTQDIPARMVTGYSSGERVDEDRWVVRGMNAHAWVEVYVPGAGWVEFDPTPSAPYEDARQEALEQAREEGAEDVDTDESGGEPWSPETDDRNATNTSTDMDEPSNVSREGFDGACDDPDALERGMLTFEEVLAMCSAGQAEAMGVNPAAAEFAGHGETPGMPDVAGDDGDDGNDTEETGIAAFPLEHVGIALALLVAGIAGARRTNVPDRVRYSIGIRWQGRTVEPVGVTERAWARLETYLEATYGGRRTGESVRAYVGRLDAAYDLDQRIIDVTETYERARYGPDGVDVTESRRVVTAVDAVVGTRIPRFR